MKKANRLEFYHELFELIVRDPIIQPKGIAQYFEYSGRGKANSTLLNHLQNMYYKKISFPPKLKLKPHDNFIPAGYICHKKNMTETYSTFKELKKNTDIWYINMLSGADFFVVSKNHDLNLKKYDLDIHMKSPFFHSIYTLPQGWNNEESCILDSISNFDFKKGVLKRVRYGNLDWSVLDWRIFNLTHENIRMKVSKIARESGVSHKTAKEHLWNHVVPECSIAHYFFPKGYGCYKYLYLRIYSDYEIDLVEAFKKLPCTTYVYPFEKEINVILFYELHEKILVLLEKLKEIGILNDYLLYIPIVHGGD
jgi:hypothetical protein